MLRYFAISVIPVFNRNYRRFARQISHALYVNYRLRSVFLTPPDIWLKISAPLVEHSVIPKKPSADIMTAALLQHATDLADTLPLLFLPEQHPFSQQQLHALEEAYILCHEADVSAIPQRLTTMNKSSYEENT